MAVVERAGGRPAWDQRHDGRIFDAVMGQRVEPLPAVDHLGLLVLVRQNQAAAAELAPFCRCTRTHTHTHTKETKKRSSIERKRFFLGWASVSVWETRRVDREETAITRTVNRRPHWNSDSYSLKLGKTQCCPEIISVNPVNTKKIIRETITR